MTTASVYGRIRDLDVTAIVSPVAAIAALREHMVRKQRIIAAQHPRLVTEGRDQGSVVFPDAIVQFYLTASVQERARRRAQQLAASGSEPDTASLEREIDARDRVRDHRVYRHQMLIARAHRPRIRQR